VGFIELLGVEKDVRSNGACGNVSNHQGSDAQPSRLRRVLEKSWPILDQLKNEKADDLFGWIGSCIAQVVSAGCLEFNLPRHVPLPLGVTFSFPMLQDTLSKATLMAMGKGFAITSNLDLGSHLTRGYESVRSSDLPPIKIAAIANDAVATLVSFIYQSHEDSHRKAAMGLICGTGVSEAWSYLLPFLILPPPSPGRVYFS
jgi:hexokinase